MLVANLSSINQFEPQSGDMVSCSWIAAICLYQRAMLVVAEQRHISSKVNMEKSQIREAVTQK
jgi:hypothetical protein